MENKLMVTKGEEGGINQEFGVKIYTIVFLKHPFPCFKNCVRPPALWFSKGQSAQLLYT